MRPTPVNGVRCTGCNTAFERFERFEAHECGSTER